MEQEFSVFLPSVLLYLFRAKEIHLSGFIDNCTHSRIVALREFFFIKIVDYRIVINIIEYIVVNNIFSLCRLCILMPIRCQD